MRHENIILVGPMGAGKTTIGRQLAKRLKKTFVDSDHEIEQRTGAVIGLIFDIEGEQGFRERESRMLRELTQEQNIVLATGGGAILSADNRAVLRKSGIVVYLRTSINTQLRRTANSKTRPLLDVDDPRSKLESLMKEREPMYRQEADITVDSEGRSIHHVVREIIGKLEAIDR